MVSERKQDLNFTKDRKIHGEAMHGVQFKHKKRSTDLMFMLRLNETIDQLTMANSVRWHGDVLRSEGGHIMRRALDFDAEWQRKKGRLKRTWKRWVGEESMKVGLRMKDALCRSKWSVGVNKVAAGLRWIWPNSLIGNTTRFKTLVSLPLCQKNMYFSHLKEQ